MLKTLGIQDLEAYTGLPRRTIHFYVKEGLIPPPEGAGRGAYYGWHHVHALKLIGALKAETHLRLEGIREILQQLPPEIMWRWSERIENGKRTASDLAARYAGRPKPGETNGGAPPLDEDGEPRNLMYSIDPPADLVDRVTGLDPRTGPVMEAGFEETIVRDRAGSDEAPTDEARGGEVPDDDTPDGDAPGDRDMDHVTKLTDMPEKAPLRIGATRSRGLFGRLMRKEHDGGAPFQPAPETWKRIRLADDVEIQIRDDASDERRRQIEVIVELAKGMLDE